MNGARQLVRDEIIPLISRGDRVLDICCGDCWLREYVIDRGAYWQGIDVQKAPAGVSGHHQANVAELHLADLGKHELVVSSWGLQHLMGEEALGWLVAAKCLAPDGRFVYIGRWMADAGRELRPIDPLNAYSIPSLRGLALACGLVITSWRTYQYEGENYIEAPVTSEIRPNALVAIMEHIQ